MVTTTIQDRIPSEFLYWEHVSGRRVQLARRGWRLLWGCDPQPPDELVRRFARSFYEADPVAEAFVEDVYMRRGAGEGRRMLDQALEHGVESVPDAPDSMVRLYREFETDPEWLDRHLVERGARVFRRYGTSVFSFATTSTLETLRRLIPPLDDAADRVQRRRRNRWYYNETGGSEAELGPVEEFRR